MNKRIAVLLSGRGSNFLAISDNIRSGKLDAEIACVLSNVADAPGLVRARELGYDAIFLNSRGKEREDYDREVAKELRRRDVELICLAGFMRLLSPYLIREFPNRILNIHPALLPAFPGLHAQKQALEYGVKYSGCTVHLVDEGVDTGPIVLQAIVPVLDDDDEDRLSARILKEEHRIYSEAIDLVLRKRIVVSGRRVLQR
ncbi:MAG: phosphoribosylglycinamide formyltransferase [Acidobacteria bacterium]|nr:phosphoribosylglycinamide formyltransferase [Acidobacteriota bacterium]